MEVTGFGKKVFASAPGHEVGGGILEIEKGKKTDMMFHMETSKIVYVLSGNVVVWVIRDGKVVSLTLGPHSSFFVRPGLVHQFEAVEDTIVVEFVSDVTKYRNDESVIAKGTQLPQEPVKEGEFAKMTPEDDAAVEKEKEEAVVEKEEVVVEKKPTKKKTTRKKTTRKTSKKKAKK